MSKRSKGVCKFCGKEYTKAAMIKHLTACQKRKDLLDLKSSSEKQSGYFSLAVEGTYRKEYWLMLEVREDLDTQEFGQVLKRYMA
ncbi:hypothetical protein SCACP_11310 [Sporomusa carbonis]|uniref:hypothetical protein n=1 Tax=Sporomusa carbonis TaxID=3076075 RepID=UPI003A788523